MPSFMAVCTGEGIVAFLGSRSGGTLVVAASWCGCRSCSFSRRVSHLKGVPQEGGTPLSRRKRAARLQNWFCDLANPLLLSGVAPSFKWCSGKGDHTYHSLVMPLTKPHFYQCHHWASSRTLYICWEINAGSGILHEVPSWMGMPLL